MDLGLKGKAALVCASSKGLGRGCATALAAEGVDLVLVARGAEALAATAQHLRETSGAKVVAIAADITTEAGRALALDAGGLHHRPEPADRRRRLPGHVLSIRPSSPRARRESATR